MRIAVTGQISAKIAKNDICGALIALGRSSCAWHINLVGSIVRIAANLCAGKVIRLIDAENICDLANTNLQAQPGLS